MARSEKRYRADNNDEMDERDYSRDDSTRGNSNWVPYVLIPLLIITALLLLPALFNSGNNKSIQNTSKTVPGQGGGPYNISPSTSVSSSPTPSVKPSIPTGAP